MKLQSSKQKQTKTLIIIGVAVLALALVIGLAFCVNEIIKDLTGESDLPQEPVTTLGINVSKYPQKLKYLVGEPCDWTGLQVQVVMNKQSETYFVGLSELEVTGFDSSAPVKEQVITVKYQEFTTTFKVEIEEKKTDPPQMVSIRLSDNFKTTWTMDEWNSPYKPKFYKVDIICTYSDGSEKTEPMKKHYVVGNFPDTVEEPGVIEFIVHYAGVETTVKVTITN